RARMIACGDEEPSSMPESARIIADQADRMASIIRQLLDFARPRAPHKEQVDVASIARETLRMLEPMARSRGIDLAFSGNDSATLAAVDSAQAQQVLSNLIVNAIQAMRRPGQVSVSVTAEESCPPAGTGRMDNEFVRIDVRDQGDGIAPEYLERVFEPFF